MYFPTVASQSDWSAVSEEGSARSGKKAHEVTLGPLEPRVKSMCLSGVCLEVILSLKVRQTFIR